MFRVLHSVPCKTLGKSVIDRFASDSTCQRLRVQRAVCISKTGERNRYTRPVQLLPMTPSFTDPFTCRATSNRRNYRPVSTALNSINTMINMADKYPTHNTSISRLFQIRPAKTFLLFCSASSTLAHAHKLASALRNSFKCSAVFSFSVLRFDVAPA